VFAAIHGPTAPPADREQASAARTSKCDQPTPRHETTNPASQEPNGKDRADSTFQQRIHLIAKETGESPTLRIVRLRQTSNASTTDAVEDSAATLPSDYRFRSRSCLA